MTSKPITRGSRRVAYAIEALSKSTLADILLDRVAAEIGEDASDEQVVAHLQPWLDTVQRLRRDRPVSLAKLLARLDASEARYLARQEQLKQQAASSLEHDKLMAAKIAEINRQKLKEPLS